MQRKPLPDWDDASLDDAPSGYAPHTSHFRGIASSSKHTTPSAMFSADRRREHSFKSELARDRMSPIHFRKNSSFVSTPSAPSHQSHPSAHKPATPTIVPISPPPPPTDIYPQSQVLHARERLLHIIAAVTSLITAASTIDNTITTTAKLDEKLLDTLFRLPHFAPSVPGDLPELSTLEQKMHSLTSSLHKCFVCLAEQLVVVEKTYRQQLMDLRGITNQAMRNAIQSEKASLTHTITTLQQQHNTDVESLREELESATRTISSLKHDLEAEKSKTSTANEAAVVIAQQYEERLANIGLELEKQVSARLDAARNDVRGRDDLYERRIEDIKDSYEAQVRLIREHYENQVSTLTRQIAEKEEADKRLNQQITTLQLQLSQAENHESTAIAGAVSVAVTQAKEVANQQISELEAVIAKHKLEIAELKEKINSTAASQDDFMEMELSKQRNILLTRHQEEISAVAAKHNQEIRKLKALVEVKASELNVKSKRLYEQEITRLVAENDRLRRQLARTTNTTASITTTPPENASATYSPPRSAIRSPARSTRSTGVATPLTKPILRSTVIPTSTSPNQQGSRWGQMSVSMLQQEQHEDVVSPPSSPPPRGKEAKLPHAFPLEMAFQSSLKSNGSIGAQQNIVGRYMGQLQKYIEGQPITTTDSIFDESNSLLRPRGLLSSSSSSDDNNHSYDDDRDDDSLE